MVDKETRRSRRARRREEQGADEPAESTESAEGPEDDAEASADSGEADDEAAAPDETGEPEADEAEAGGEEAADEDEEPEERPRPVQKKKKKKKKKRAEPERIRDRNERIRERAAARRREKREAASQGLAAGEMVDDALARWTQSTTSWVRDHFNVLQWVIVLLIAGGIGWEIYSWRHEKNIEKASDKLIAGVEDETAKLPDDEVTGEEAQFDPRRSFPNGKARAAAAEKSYQEAASVAKGSGSSILATLGLAGVQYDQGKFSDAQKNYESVKDSPLAKFDSDVKGRALEGIGMCLEAENKLDAAAKAYRALENAEVPGMGSLALYHQARIAFLKGEKDKANQLLKKVQKELADSDSPYPPNGYLSTMTRQLIQTINPSAAPASQGPGMQLSPAQIDQLREQIKKNPAKLRELMRQMGLKAPPGLPAPPPTPAPAPAPAGSAP